MATLPKTIKVSVLDIEIYARTLREQERELMVQDIEIEKLKIALEEIANEKTFNYYDCADCTEEVYETGKALVQTARDVLKEGE